VSDWESGDHFNEAATCSQLCSKVYLHVQMIYWSI